ncbi:hypothetical protein NL676_004731 [Syzygium grande]|nr:hypothetical protein NL676_004731 [Syzygium grande]
MDHRAIEIDELQDEAFENDPAGSGSGSVAGSIGEGWFESMTKREPFMPNGLTSPPRNYDEAGPGDAAAGSHNDIVTYCLARVRRRLGERERRFRAGTSSCTIFRISPTLRGINLKAEQPEIVPYFLLESLFHFSSSTRVVAKTDNLCTLALRVFNLAYPRSVAPLEHQGSLQCKHLLDLFYLTLFPTNPVPRNYPQKYRPSDQSVPCVTCLRPSGIKFKSRKTENFLDISFRKRVLEIPSITINDFMTTVLINCVALEQCQENSSKYITDYVSFMHCLINQPKDVSLLCSDGIITRFSHDDQYVANLFNKLGKSIVFNVHDCYLSKQFEELESYFYSNWANMMRTYFSSPWSVISVFSAFLVIVLTMTQTVFAVLSYHFH